MVKPIEINSREDVEKIVHFADIYKHHVDVSCGSVIIDAKSVLGLLTLVGKSGTKLVFSDHDGEMRIHRLNRCLHKAGIT